MWPRSVVNRSSAFYSSTSSNSSSSFGQPCYQKNDHESEKKCVSNNAVGRSNRFMHVASSVLEDHERRKKLALKKPFFVEEEDGREEDEKKNQSGRFVVKVAWEGSEKPFATIRYEKQNVKVQFLRAELERTGKIPSNSSLQFLVDGAPLNEIQEAFCGIQVFSSVETGLTDTQPLVVYARIANDCAQSISNQDKERRHQLLQSVSDKQSAKKLTTEDLRRLLAKMVSLCGRKVLNQLFDRFDENASGKLKLTELTKMIKELCEGNPALQNFAASDVDHIMKELDKDLDGTLSYAEFAACLPAHLQATGFQKVASSKECKNVLEKIATKMFQLQLKGYSKLVDRNVLINAKERSKPVEIPSYARYSIPRSSDLSASKEEDDSTYYHPGIGLEGTISGFQKYTNKCTFHVREVDLVDLFAIDFDKNRTGKVSFEAFAKVLDRFECGQRDLRISGATLREALSPFKVSNGYDYPTFLAYCVPKSDLEKATSIETVVSNLRRVFLDNAFGGIELRRLFKKLDPEQTGAISVHAFQEMIQQKCKFTLPKSEWNVLLDRFDPERKNKVSYLEFIAFVERGNERWSDVSKLQVNLVKAIRDEFFDPLSGTVDIDQAFEFFNIDKDGVICEDTFLTVFETLRDGKRFDYEVLQRKDRRKTPVLDDLVKAESEFHQKCNIHRIVQCFPEKHERRLKTRLIPRHDQHLKPVKQKSLGMCKDSFKDFVESVKLDRDYAKSFRDSVLGAWNNKQVDFSTIFQAMEMRPEEIKRQDELYNAKVRPDFYNTKLNYQSIARAYKEILQEELQLEASFGIVKDHIKAPYGFHEFMDFLFPNTVPTLHEIVVRVQRRLKTKSLGGMAIRSCFNSFDPSVSGFVTVENFKKGITRLDLGLSGHDIDLLLDSGIIRIQKTQDRISYDEFVRFALQSNQSKYQLNPTRSAHNNKKSNSFENHTNSRPQSRSSNPAYQPQYSRSQVNNYLTSTRPF